MGFICNALIRKNNKQIIDKLKSIGWVESSNIDNYPQLEIIHDIHPIGKIYGVDCGENEDLFFALASLRNDTDENQLFMMDVEIYTDIPQGSVFYSTDINGQYHVGTKIEPLYCHKMTEKEIIDYFNKK